MTIDFGYIREFTYDHNDEASLAKELVLQVRKVIGPFAAPKKIFIVSDLPKTRSGKASPALYLPQRSFNNSC
jgi:acyl-coenzyme A synthetase/AMP-(fatty) acid ligase